MKHPLINIDKLLRRRVESKAKSRNPDLELVGKVRLRVDSHHTFDTSFDHLLN